MNSMCSLSPNAPSEMFVLVERIGLPSIDELGVSQMKLRIMHLAVFISTLLGVLLGAGCPVFAQSGNYSDSISRTNHSEPENPSSGRTRAVDERESSAEKEAERL